MPRRKKTSKNTLAERVAQLKQGYAQVSVYAFDEHRLGLKPISRRIWAPKGERPIANVQHRYEWLYLYAFANPQTGRSVFYILPNVDTESLSVCLRT